MPVPSQHPQTRILAKQCERVTETKQPKHFTRTETRWILKSTNQMREHPSLAVLRPIRTLKSGTSRFSSVTYLRIDRNSKECSFYCGRDSRRHKEY